MHMMFNQYAGLKEVCAVCEMPHHMADIHTKVRLIPNRHDIAFVEFDSDTNAALAKDGLNGFKVNESLALSVSYSKK